MQVRLDGRTRALAVRIGVGLVGLALLWLLRRPILRTAGLLLGAAGLAFLVSPLANRFEGRLGRTAASLLALLCAALAVGALAALLLPAMVGQARSLAKVLPDSIGQLSAWLEQARHWIGARFPGVALPEVRLDGVQGIVSGLAGGTLALAGSAAGTLSRLSLMVMLAFFFLCDRDRLLLRLELLTPARHRCTAVRMGGAVLRECRLYLQAQLMVSACVGALSAAGLALSGVPSPLVLGALVGLFNMVPYFGPFIGGVPAVLAALGLSWRRAALAAGVLIVVQQLDSAVISPRVMGSLTGFSPAAVLLAIYAGAGFGGVAGMLAALPALMSARTVYRVFVQSRENI